MSHFLQCQLANHIPNNDCISTKMGLLATMKDFHCNALLCAPAPPSPRLSPRSACSMPPWLPETYNLDIPGDRLALLRSEAAVKQTTGADGLWIYKPSSSNRCVVYDESFESLNT